MSENARIIVGDVFDGLRSLETESIQCCVTSPPYWGLRDYGVAGQIGLEPTPEAFVEKMVEVFREVWRVMRKDGTLWLNIGDSYAGSWGAQSRGPTSPGTIEGAGDPFARQIRAAARLGCGTGSMKRTPGLKPKDLCMIPWRVALALQADGWWIRSVIVWAKKSPMPESVTDRPTSSWEPIFLMAKNERYWYDAEAVAEASSSGEGSPAGFAGYSERAEAMGRAPSGNERPGVVVRNGATRNLRNVWHLGPEPYPEAHFATFPSEIPRRCIKAGCTPNGVVLDPFLGSGTTLAVARQLGRRGVGIELNPEYAELARIRIGKAEKPDTFVDPRAKDAPLFTQEHP